MWEILDFIKDLQKVQFAQNGAKLKGVEVSETPSVIPEGELHKNRHDIDLEGITKKGIPVITTDAENPTTFQEIQNGGNIVEHCEIEREEVIFSKELTDYVEEAREHWHNGEDNLLEVGKRIVKELITNTEDNTGLIDKLEE